MKISPTFLTLGAFAVLSACSNQPAEKPAEDTPITAEPAPDPDAPVSILRADVEPPELPEIALEPVTVTIGFPEGGDTLDPAATAALEKLISSDQIAGGGPITLRAHSDAGGSDAANMRASKARGAKVLSWLSGKGIAEDRITVINFGEQNPVQPNALPDGSPNDEGRAANRRVEIEVSVVETGAPDIGPADERLPEPENAG